MKGIERLWAKTSQLTGPVFRLWHPLMLHLLDAAACADVILSREPETTRKRIAEILGLTWEQARAWILLIIACHDLGKACPGFQCKWDCLVDLPLPRVPDSDINHAYVSQAALTEILLNRDWPEELAVKVASAVGCHHGERISDRSLSLLEGNRNALGGAEWVNARQELFEALAVVLRPDVKPKKQDISGPDFMLLSGLASFADWIGSNDEWFPFGIPEDCNDLPGWFEKRKACAECRSLAQAKFALEKIGERFRQCGLELHPEKTRIVYCKDINRQGDFPCVEFTFLGYTFRPRKAVDKYCRVYVNFAPAASRDALKAMRQTIRRWHLQLKCDKSLADLSAMFNPILRGWQRYYGRFYESAMSAVWKHLNDYLKRWLMRKYKHLSRHKTRARQALGRLAIKFPDAFVHWKLGCLPKAG